MNSAKRTIAFLRRITQDGLLTSDEVWSLAKFLNGHPECGESWPGNLLMPMLNSAFDDAKLTEEEMRILAETISDIEQEWLNQTSHEVPTGDSQTEPLLTRTAIMPVIDAQFEVPSAEGGDPYLVSLNEHSCTCPDWKRRAALPPHHPGRCCKHIAHAFTRSGNVFEPWFQALLDDCFARGRGTNPQLEWVLLEIPGMKATLLAGGHGPWCNVLAAGTDGYESYSFHCGENRWSYGEMPRNAQLIASALKDQFGSAAQLSQAGAIGR
jgi:hypothetical protein